MTDVSAESRPTVDQQRNDGGPTVDQQWTDSGPTLDQQWTDSGLTVGRMSTNALVEAMVESDSFRKPFLKDKIQIKVAIYS